MGNALPQQLLLPSSPAAELMASQSADSELIEESRIHLGKWKCSWAIPGEHPQPPERFLLAQCDIGRMESSFKGLGLSYSLQDPFGRLRQPFRAQAEKLDLHDCKLHTCSRLFWRASLFLYLGRRKL